jgi:hypothetical protein
MARQCAKWRSPPSSPGGVKPLPYTALPLRGCPIPTLILCECCNRYPETAKAIRHHAIWLALRREILQIADRTRNGARFADITSAIVEINAATPVTHFVSRKSSFGDIQSFKKQRTGDGVLADPDYSEVGGDGKLIGSNEMKFSFEVLGGSIREHREQVDERFRALERQQSRLLEVFEKSQKESAAREERLLEAINSQSKPFFSGLVA